MREGIEDSRAPLKKRRRQRWRAKLITTPCGGGFVAVARREGCGGNSDAVARREGRNGGSREGCGNGSRAVARREGGHEE
ncbi:hypothetical protein NL676_021472 [Syzygium grande]|nr:hypothetical protein NL676_021472 [Syzygium grande]